MRLSADISFLCTKVFFLKDFNSSLRRRHSKPKPSVQSGLYKWSRRVRGPAATQAIQFSRGLIKFGS